MRNFIITIGALGLLLTGRLAIADTHDDAGRILDAAGRQGGLIIHLGCGNGELTTALRANDSFLVQGLDTDAGNVETARKHIRSLKLYGPVSAERWRGPRLPYADNLVNLAVVSGAITVEDDELLRVLAPEGVALFIDDTSQVTGRRLVKPRPGDIDEWTHFLHDAGGNPVAHDQAVGPPRFVQWVEGPRHARSHEFTPSLAALVSSGGRIFYIVDEAPTASLLQESQWYLVARDASNGLQLWKRPITLWWPHIFGWTQGPRQLQRRLVAVGDRVYVTLGLFAPVNVLDAATGETLRVLDETKGTEEIIWHDGTLLLATRQVTEERAAEREKWTRLSDEKDSPLFTRERNAPLVKQFKRTDSQAEMSVMALDADSGRLLWKQAGAAVDGLKELTLSAAGDRAFFERTNGVVSLDLKTGEELWTAPATKMRSVGSHGVICASDDTVTALSKETGKPLWEQQPRLLSIRDAFVINDTLWLGGFKPYQGEKKARRGPQWGPYFLNQLDLATGEVLREIDPDNPEHHHRCYQNKATDRFILGGRRGTEFIDLKTGDVLWHSWARGACMYGVMPANGLFYVPPHACGCYISTKLTGFHALAATRQDVKREAKIEDRLERGPAFAAKEAPASASPAASDWPTYRHDMERSAATAMPVSAKLELLWQAEVGGKLTAPTVAGGKVFVASVDQHRVEALDAGTGQPEWSFTASARVDSPPTIQDSRAVFGCRDGRVYSVRTDDGVLAWRLRVARDERLIPAYGQLESASPSSGSVLIRDGVAYVTAGRSSYLDGGIDLCRVEVETGQILSRTPIYSPDPETGQAPKQYGPASMPGAREDILSGDGEHVFLRNLVFGLDGGTQPETTPHLLTLTGYLDDTWAHRSYWIYGTECSIATGCSSRDKDLIFGRLLAFDGATIYGYGRAKVDWSNHLLDGPYRMFAMSRSGGEHNWQNPLPIQVHAMVLASDILFVAGPQLDQFDPRRIPDASLAPLLLAISAADGAELGRCELPAPPVFDSMAAAKGRLYLTGVDGRVYCLGAQ